VSSLYRLPLLIAELVVLFGDFFRSEDASAHGWFVCEASSLRPLVHPADPSVGEDAPQPLSHRLHRLRGQMRQLVRQLRISWALPDATCASRPYSSAAILLRPYVLGDGASFLRRTHGLAKLVFTLSPLALGVVSSQ